MLRRPATRIQLTDDEVSDLIRDLQKRMFDEKVRASNLQQLNSKSRGIRSKNSSRDSQNGGAADDDYSRTPSAGSSKTQRLQHEHEHGYDLQADRAHMQFYQTLPHNLDYVGSNSNRYELVKRYYVDSNASHFQESPLHNSSANNNHNFVMRGGQSLPPGDISPSRPARRNRLPSDAGANADLDAHPNHLDANPFFQMEQ